MLIKFHYRILEKVEDNSLDYFGINSTSLNLAYGYSGYSGSSGYSGNYSPVIRPRGNEVNILQIRNEPQILEQMPNNSADSIFKKIVRYISGNKLTSRIGNTKKTTIKRRTIELN